MHAWLQEILLYIMKLVAELLSTSVETVDTAVEDTSVTTVEDTEPITPDDINNEAPPVLSPVRIASTQAAGLPKKKSVAVSVRMKGRDKGNAYNNVM